MEAFGENLKIFSTGQPQTDGTYEVMNRMVDNYYDYTATTIRMTGISCYLLPSFPKILQFLNILGLVR